VKLARAFEVFDEIVAAGLDGSIVARRLDSEHMDFRVTLSLAGRSEEQLATLTVVVERYDLDLEVDDRRNASLI
jgi:hypothetical protein